jgi:predicted peptidase
MPVRRNSTIDAGSFIMRHLATIALVPLLALVGCATIESAPITDPAPITEADMPTGFVFDSVTVSGHSRDFAVYVPRDYTPDRKWPVIVFLNGSGECGTDGQKHLAVGLAPAIMLDRESWPFIVVFPQKPEQKSTWLEHDDLVQAALDKTLASYSTDPARIYLTGLSQGGLGAWEIGAKHADRFAAIAPCCGWGDPDTLAPELAHTPCWAFHGEKDTAVNPSGTKNLVAALEKLHAPVRMTLYPDANHNCWDQAYRTEKLGEWLLTHHK